MDLKWPVPNEAMDAVLGFFRKHKDKIGCIHYGSAHDEQSGEEIHRFVIISKTNNFNWDLSDDVADLQTALTDIGVGKFDAMTVPTTCEQDLSAIMKVDMAVSQHFIAWKCGSSLNNHYLYYWLQLNKSEFERIAILLTSFSFHCWFCQAANIMKIRCKTAL